MNLTWLTTFRKVADARSYTRAAEALFITQPAVSQQVRQLELFFGAKLLNHHGRELQLTEAGRQVYEVAQQVEVGIADLRKRLDETANRAHGLVTIVSGPTPLLHYVPRILKRYWETFPDISVKTLSRTRSDITDAIRSGQADVGLQTALYLDPAVVATPCRDDWIVCVASPEHTLAEASSMNGEELQYERTAILPSGTETRKLVDEWFSTRGLRLHSLIEVSSVEEVRTSALANLGIGFLSRYAVQEDLAAGRLALLDIKDFRLPRTTYVIRRRDVRDAVASLVGIFVDARTDPLFWHG